MSGYRECFEQAVAAAVTGATVLTANTRSARSIRAAAEQRARLSQNAWLTPDVIPYGAFIERLYSDALVAGLLDLQALQSEQELHVWRQIIERSTVGREMLLPESAAALAANSFRVACEYDIPLDSPQMGASSDTRAFAGWTADFQRQLSTHGWTCSALFTQELAPVLSLLQIPSDLFVFLPESTPAQQSFLNALEEAGVGITISPEYDSSVDVSALRYEFDGVSDELRAAAQWARQQVETSPGARIGVILFDLDRKRPQIESTFRSVFHPEHLLGVETPSAFEIASPLVLADYPVVRCALQLLSLATNSIDFDLFRSTLTSPYLAPKPEAVAKFLARVQKHASRQVSFENLMDWLDETHELPDLRSELVALPKHSAFSSEQAPAYWADISRRILEAFGWPSGVTLSSAEYQCTKSWRELLTSISSLELLDWRADFRGFLERLQSAAATQYFKPETLNAPVQIMDATESESSVFDALWIGSCSDDMWPDSPRFSPLIPIVLLREAGVALVGTQEAEARISRITSRLLQSAPQVSFSMARRTDDERDQRWSPFFVDLPVTDETIEIAPHLAEMFNQENLEVFSDSIAPALRSGEVARGGTSLLQEQSNCPFRAFAIRRLFAKEAQGPNEALAPTDRGKVVDRALQLVWEQLKDSEGLRRPDLATIVESAVDMAMQSELPSGDDQWTLRFRKLERQRTVEVIAEWLTLESTRKPFHVLDHQHEVELSLGGMKIVGRLDRLDEIDDSHLVIDYKTGSTAVSTWQVPRPRMPQLPFYALAIRQQKFNLAGISFATVRKGESQFRGYLREKDALPCPDPSKRCFDGMAFDEYVDRWADELERIAASFVRGDAAVDPKIAPGKSGSSCEHCHLTSLCRISELADADSDDTTEGECDE